MVKLLTNMQQKIVHLLFKGWKPQKKLQKNYPYLVK